MAWAKALSDISVKLGSDGSRNVGGAAMDRENGGSRYNNNGIIEFFIITSIVKFDFYITNLYLIQTSLEVARTP